MGLFVGQASHLFGIQQAGRLRLKRLALPLG